SLAMTNDTISGNRAGAAGGADSGTGGSGGGVVSSGGNLLNDTFSDNRAATGIPVGSGRALDALSGTTMVEGSIFAGLANGTGDNTSGAGTTQNCTTNGGSITDGGYNVTDDTSCGFSGAGEDQSDAAIDLSAPA